MLFFTATPSASDLEYAAQAGIIILPSISSEVSASIWMTLAYSSMLIS